MFNLPSCCSDLSTIEIVHKEETQTSRFRLLGRSNLIHKDKHLYTKSAATRERSHNNATKILCSQFGCVVKIIQCLECVAGVGC